MSSAKQAPRPPASVVGGSRLLWLLWLIWTAAIIYGSLWPWQAWRDHGLAPWTFLKDPWPRYWTWFDVFSNVLLYLPFGLFLAVNLRGKAWWVLLIGTLSGASLSGLVEAAQSYLPQRIPSLLDCATNALGSSLGSLLALGLRGPWARLRGAVRGWWKDDTPIPTALIVSWITLQLYWFLAQSGLSKLLFLPSSASLAVVFSPASTPAWRMLESALVSLLIVHAAARGSMRWASIGALQVLLGLLLLEQFLLRSNAAILADEASLQALWMLSVAWCLVLAAFLWALEQTRPSVRAWVGIALACLWPLRSLLRLAADLLAATTIDAGLGPGLGPSPEAPEGLVGALLGLEAWVRHFPRNPSDLPAPGLEAAVALIFGHAVHAPDALTASPVLGRPWQHFDAIILAADQAWRWIALAWFLVLAAQGSEARKRSPRPRRKP